MYRTPPKTDNRSNRSFGGTEGHHIQGRSEKSENNISTSGTFYRHLRNYTASSFRRPQ